MKEVLEHIVSSLVVNKDKVNIEEDILNGGNEIHYHVRVAEEDFGKVIGHEGKIAKSIRSIMGAIATTKNVKVVVDIR